MRRISVYDPLAFGLALVLTVLGLIFIFDAGYPRAMASGRGWLPPEFRTQLIMTFGAIFVGAVVSMLSGEKWYRLSKFIWFAAFISLFLPMIPGLAYAQNGASRWFKLPGLPPIQPAEFVKVAVIVYLAGLLAKRKPWVTKPGKDWAQILDRNFTLKVKRWIPFVWVLIAVVLIEKEPDLGTAAVVLLIGFGMLIAGNVTKFSIVTGALALAMITGWLVTHEEYRMNRIRHHAERWSERNMDDIGWQTVQSELGMASGAVLGVGVGAGRAKHVLPAATTDFINATIGEEFGLIGMLVVTGLLGALTLRLLKLASDAKTQFGALVLSGTAFWIGGQACVNIMMANGLLPAIGIPMPFISSGGSSLVALWIALGICNSCLAPVRQTEEAYETGRDGWGHRRTRLSRA